MKRYRLYWHTLPTHVLLVLSSCLICYWVSSSTFRNFYLQQQITLLKNIGSPLSPRLSQLLSTQKTEKIPLLLKRVQPLTSYVGIFDSANSISAISDSHPLTASEQLGALMATTSTAYPSGIVTDLNGQSYLSVLIPLDVEGPKKYLVLQKSTEPLEKKISELRNAFLAISALLTLLALLVNRFTDMKISQFVQHLIVGVEQLKNGNFNHKFQSAPQLEFDQLSSAMNATMESISRKLSTITQQRRELDAILRSMSEGVIVIDKHDQVLRINDKCASFFGIKSSRVKGQSVHELIRNSALQNILAECLQQQVAIERNIRIGQDSAQFLQASVSPLIDAEGESIGALAVLHDITALKQMEEMRKEFVANVSHELRTPITSIKGFVETLLDGAIHEPETAERFLKIISKQSERLSAIIDDLLSLSRLERDNSDAGKVPTDIRTILLSAAGLCEQQAHEKSIAISVECPSDLQAEVNPHLLEQAITNLVENAIKYSETSTQVDLRAYIEAGRLYLEVQDNGPGIDKKYLPRLFERFYRVDEGRSRDQGGTGLGLAIVKHIAQAHGGRASIESTLGKGSKFSLILPAAA